MLNNNTDLHYKYLQGFTGTLQGNWSAGISNLRGLHVYPAIPVIFEVNKKSVDFLYILFTGVNIMFRI